MSSMSGAGGGGSVKCTRARTLAQKRMSGCECGCVPNGGRTVRVFVRFLRWFGRHARLRHWRGVKHLRCALWHSEQQSAKQQMCATQQQKKRTRTTAAVQTHGILVVVRVGLHRWRRWAKIVVGHCFPIETAHNKILVVVVLFVFERFFFFFRSTFLFGFAGVEI